jgi:dienelactone hydrolase
MKIKFGLKISIISLILLAFFGCQNKEVSNSSNKTNTNKPKLTNEGTPIPAPQKVQFESADKVVIVGTFYESPKVNSPAVLMLHQWQSNRGSYDEFARRIQAKGFGVLAIDGRGFGDSTKTTDGATVKTDRGDETVKGMKADVDNAFQFLTKQKNVNAQKIGIVGASYGSSLAMIYGAENKDVAAVALLSPGLNYFGNLPIEEAVKNYGDRALLLVAAEDDKESADTVKKLKDSVKNERYETHVYQRGGHGTELFTTKVGLEDLLDNFLTTNLQR